MKNWRSDILKKTLVDSQDEATKATFDNISRMIRLKTHTPRESSKKAKLKRFDNEEPIKAQAQEFNSDSFRVSRILEANFKNPEYREHFKRHAYLAKSYVQPEHLTILNQRVAREAATLISSKLNKETKTYFEILPRCGVFTRELLETKPNIKTVFLQESNKTYFKELEELRHLYKSSHDVHVVRNNYPFAMSPLIEFAKYFDESPVAVFNILPWSLKGYLQSLYEAFCYKKSYFSFKKVPEFYFYVPEHRLAKLEPQLEEKFLPFNSSLSAYSAILSKVEVLGKHDVQYFHPYPLIQPIANERPLEFPLNSIDFKNMYLISIKFDIPQLVSEEHRGAFFQFIHRLWSQPKLPIGEALSCVVTNEKHLGELQNQLKLDFNTKLRELHAFQLFEIFDCIIKNEQLSLSLIKPK